MKTVTKLNANARKWVRALRSGKFKQTKKVLARVRAGETRYCCLGVACELYRRETKEIEKKVVKNVVYFDDKQFTLLRDVQSWLGLEGDCGEYEGSSLAEQNDDGVKFEKIADIIESQPKGLFR